MAFTTFPNEKVLVQSNGCTLVECDALHRPGRQYVAVTRDGFRTDYPHWDGVNAVRWDNPEWFPVSFREKASRAIFNARKEYDAFNDSAWQQKNIGDAAPTSDSESSPASKPVTGGLILAASEGDAAKKLMKRIAETLGPNVQQRIQSLIKHPSQETWNDACTLLMNAKPGRRVSLWQAVRAVNPDFPPPDYKTGKWPQIPSRELITEALKLSIPEVKDWKSFTHSHDASTKFAALTEQESNFIRQTIAARKTAHEKDMEYIYRGTLLCDECGPTVQEELNAQGIEDDGDSDTYPQGPASIGEADSPQYCDKCGTFLHNPLTQEGYDYIRETFEEDPENPVAQEWMEYYGDDTDLKGKPVREDSSSVTGVKQAAKFDFGDRVRCTYLDPYSGIREGQEGTVDVVATFKGKSVHPDPMRKLLMVKWDDGRRESVPTQNVEIIRKGKGPKEVLPVKLLQNGKIIGQYKTTDEAYAAAPQPWRKAYDEGFRIKQMTHAEEEKAKYGSKQAGNVLENARWHVMKSKAGHYWAVLRSKETGALIARSTLPWGSPEQAKAEVLRYLAENGKLSAEQKISSTKKASDGLDSLDEFTRAYIEAALWSSNDESDERGGEPLDRNYSIDDIAAETMAQIKADCDKFQAENNALLVEDSLVYQTQYSVEEQGGHDFWLTRNGHGSGFWDGDWKKEAADRLTKAAKRFGEYDLYVGDDGLIYGS